MPPFQYDTFVNPYVGTIGQLIGREGQIRAQQAQRIGEIEARAAENRGQIWGNAIQGIGNTVAGTLKDLTDPAKKMQMLQLQDAQRMNAAQKSYDRAVSGQVPSQPLPEQPVGPTLPESYLTPDGLHDIKKLTEYLSSQGFGSVAPQVLHAASLQNDSIEKFSEMKRKSAIQQLILAGDMAHGVLTLSESLGVPIDVAMGMATAGPIAANAVDKREIEDVKAKILALSPEQQAEALKQIRAQAEKLAPTQKLSEGEIVTGRYGGVVAKGASKPRLRAAEGSVAVDENGAPIQGTSVPRTAAPETESQRLLRLKQIEEIDAKLHGTIPLTQYEKARLAQEREALTQGDAAVQLTPEAKKMTAYQFAMTGVLPPMGMGKAAARVRTDIINEASRLFDSLDLPSQVASYQANKKSLSNIVGTLDTLTSFESAGLKNLDLFTSQAKDLIDTGMPWLNTPVRMINEGMLGDPKQKSAFAASQTALREIARVTNDPKLSGVLSDDARKSVADLMGTKDATLPMIFAVANTLKMDMQNVRESLSDQKRAIEVRIATPPPGVGQNAPPSADTPREGDTKPITDAGYPAGAKQTFRGGQWVRTE